MADYGASYDDDDDYDAFAALDPEEDELDEEYWKTIPYPEPHSIDDPTWFSIKGDY